MEKASNKELDMVWLGNLNYNCVDIKSFHTNPVHYVETFYDMSYLMTNKGDRIVYGEHVRYNFNRKSRSPQTFRCDKENLKWPFHDIYWIIFTEKNITVFA